MEKKAELKSKKQKLIKFIKDNPGKFGAEIPAQLRRFLLELEKSGKIVYSAREGWRIA